jgi:hypothetical protein
LVSDAPSGRSGSRRKGEEGDKKMQIATLKNGSEEAMPLVVITQMIVNRLMEGFPGVIDLYELVQKCRDRDHRFFGDSGKRLEAEGLVDKGGGIHDSTRNIILSMASGEGLTMTFGNPVTSVREESIHTTLEAKAEYDGLADRVTPSYALDDEPLTVKAFRELLAEIQGMDDMQLGDAQVTAALQLQPGQRIQVGTGGARGFSTLTRIA